MHFNYCQCKFFRKNFGSYEYSIIKSQVWFLLDREISYIDIFQTHPETQVETKKMENKEFQLFFKTLKMGWYSETLFYAELIEMNRYIIYSKLFFTKTFCWKLPFLYIFSICRTWAFELSRLFTFACSRVQQIF